MSKDLKTVTRDDLASALYCEVGLSHAESKVLVNRVFAIIADELAKGEDVKLANFGVFSISQKKARLGRNPKTGKDVPIDARTVLTFKASEKLKARVNKQNPKSWSRHHIHP